MNASLPDWSDIHTGSRKTLRGLRETDRHNVQMRHRLISILMIIAMSWQSFAFAGQVLVSDATDEVEHALLHWKSEMHHHDDQNKVHKDSSIESTCHLAADSCHHAPFVLAEPVQITPVAQRCEVQVAIVICHSDPFLQGIRRPPR